MAESNRLLVVDDDPEIAELITLVAEGLGYATTTVAHSDQILDAVRTVDPGLIVLDLMMPGADGVQVLRALADEGCAAEIILFSGADSRTLSTAARLGESHGLKIRELLQKPIALEDLEAALVQCRRVPSKDPAAELRDAIVNREICVFYQPKVALGARDGWSVTGLEALARWRHPVRGMISPAEFIPLAERTGMIGALTDLVVELAIEQTARLGERGHAIEMAVNLSPLVLSDVEVPDQLARSLATVKVGGERFIAEVTEGVAMGDSTQMMENLTRFRLKGMKLSMDDFGTGYSSLVQLYRMPFSELKIDKSFVMDVDRKEEARTLVRSIVDLAHNLNLTLCAEGVETLQTLTFLRSIGCDQAQGFFISKPLDQGDLDEFLQIAAAVPTTMAAAASPAL